MTDRLIHPEHIIRHFDLESFQLIHLKFNNKCGQDWRKVPEDILIQTLAEYESPKWSITLSDKMNKYLKLFIDKGENFDSFVQQVKWLALDVEIYRQGLAQAVHDRRVEHIIYRGQTLVRMKEDYVLLDRLGIDVNDVDELNELYLTVAYAMKHTQRKSDEQLLFLHKIGLYAICKAIGMTKRESYLTLFEILKILNFKDYSIADVSKRCDVLKAEYYTYEKNLKKAFSNPIQIV